MTFRPYADRPLRLSGQLSADLLVVGWVAMWAWVAVQIHQAVTALGTAGFQLRDAADGVAENLREAGDVANRVPLAGDRLAAPLDSAGGAAGGIAASGQRLGDDITSAALPMALIIVVTTVLPVVVPWLLLRIRFARRAKATAHLAASPAGTRLLALRALANAPTRRLAALSDDPVGDWARQDDEAIRALAALELRRAGLTPRRLLSPP